MSKSNVRSFSIRPSAWSSRLLGKGPGRARQKFRPGLLPLETRALLSTLTVTNDNDSGPGSLRAQLGAANAGDTINFAPSAYGTINLTSGTLEVATSVNIQGPGAQNVTVNGGHHFTDVDVQAGVTATISGLTITGGQSQAPVGLGGGGITNQGNLTVSGAVITGNAAVIGGGIATSTGSLTVTNSTITGNSAGNGGGIGAGGIGITGPVGPLTITGSMITGNSGYSTGGGIFDFGGPLTIAGSSITTNSTGEFGLGGGIDSEGGPVTLTGSTVSGNTAFIDGGIRSYGGGASLTDCTVSGNLGGGIGIYGAFGYPTMPPAPTLTVTGSTVSGNTGSLYGAGINAVAANVTVTDSLIANNSGAPGGGGIAMEDYFITGPTPGTDTLTVVGTIFSGNEAGAGGAIFAEPGATVSVTGSAFVNNVADGASGFTGAANGGAIDLVGLVQATISGSTFTGNQAIGSSTGGGAYGGAIDLNNPASAYGPVAPGTVTIQGCTFAGNTAQGGIASNGVGGAIDNQGDNLTVTGAVFVGDSAVGGSGGNGDGGGVANSGTASFTGVLIALNSADGGTGGSGDGGGLYIAAGAITTLKNDLILANSASTAGNNVYQAPSA